MLFMFGKLDTQFHNYRSITILGLLIGSMNMVAKSIKAEEAETPELLTEEDERVIIADNEFTRNIQNMGLGTS